MAAKTLCSLVEVSRYFLLPSTNAVVLGHRRLSLSAYISAHEAYKLAYFGTLFIHIYTLQEVYASTTFLTWAAP
jgi:hypothetical protein